MGKRKSMTDAELREFKKKYTDLLAKRRAGDHGIVTFLAKWAKKFDKDVLRRHMGTVLEIKEDEIKVYFRLFDALKVVKDECLWAALSRAQILKVASIKDAKSRRKVVTALLKHLETARGSVVPRGTFDQVMQAYVKPVRSGEKKKENGKKGTKKARKKKVNVKGHVRGEPGSRLEQLQDDMNKLREQFRQIATSTPFISEVIQHGCSEPAWVLGILGLPKIKVKRRA